MLQAQHYTWAVIKLEEGLQKWLRLQQIQKRALWWTKTDYIYVAGAVTRGVKITIERS